MPESRAEVRFTDSPTLDLARRHQRAGEKLVTTVRRMMQSWDAVSPPPQGSPEATPAERART